MARLDLLLWTADLTPGVRRDGVRHLDVVPTVLKLLRIEATGVPGISLLFDEGTLALAHAPRAARTRSREAPKRRREARSGAIGVGAA